MISWKTWTPSTVTWPSASYEDLDRGYKWMTLRRSPCSFLNLKHKGTGQIVRAYVGVPIPLDPQSTYSIQGQGIAGDGLLAGTTPTVTARDRTIEVVLSDAPIHGGIGRLAVLVSDNASRTSQELVRVTCEGATDVQARLRVDDFTSILYVSYMAEADDAANEAAYPQAATTVNNNTGTAHSYGVSANYQANLQTMYVGQQLVIFGTITATGAGTGEITVVQRMR